MNFYDQLERAEEALQREIQEARLEVMGTGFLDFSDGGNPYTGDFFTPNDRQQRVNARCEFRNNLRRAVYKWPETDHPVFAGEAGHAFDMVGLPGPYQESPARVLRYEDVLRRRLEAEIEAAERAAYLEKEEREGSAFFSKLFKMWVHVYDPRSKEILERQGAWASASVEEMKDAEAQMKSGHPAYRRHTFNWGIAPK